MQKTVILGSEYNENVWQALKSVLKELGATPQDSSWGVGGSQELTSIKVSIAGKSIEVSSETYVGISISGDSALIDQIGSTVASRLWANSNM